MHAPPLASSWRVAADRILPLDRPRLIGILNLTPDSFSDGGRFSSPRDAVEAGLAMLEAGASVIDVGGESTRPGSQPVGVDEQIRRTAPVIESIRRRAPRDAGLISIDTTRSEVARAALDAGADIINDQAAGMDHESMFDLAASRGCGLILMHRLTSPKGDVYSHQYQAEPDYGGDVVAAVRNFLDSRARAAMAAGVDRGSIVIDPGLGFGKTVRQNYELMGRIRDLAALSYPVLSAASRKSFIGKISGIEQPSDRDAASAAVSVAHYLAGIRLFRVHCVAAHRQALAVAEEISNAVSSPAPEMPVPRG